MTERRRPTTSLPGIPGSSAGSEQTPIRLLQWASVIRRALQQRLSEGLADPRFQGLVSIVSVEVSPDEQRALVRVSVSPADRGRLAVSALRSAAAHLRHVVRDESALRHVPRLDFILDESGHRQMTVEQAIAEGLRREGIEPGPDLDGEGVHESDDEGSIEDGSDDGSDAPTSQSTDQTDHT
jgi:ribosome-binding factor A